MKNLKIAYVNLSLCGAPPHDPASPVRAYKKALPKKLFCDMIDPWIKGGAEKRIHEIAKRLVERGHEVHHQTLEKFDQKCFASNFRKV